jgi:hypothetical protein
MAAWRGCCAGGVVNTPASRLQTAEWRDAKIGWGSAIKVIAAGTSPAQDSIPFLHKKNIKKLLTSFWSMRILFSVAW